MKKLNYEYRLGMRAVKTALAVIIGLYFSILLHLNTPVFTTIACITSMKPSMSESLEDMKRRAFTAIFGVIFGYLLSLIPASDFIKPLIAGAGILIVIYILILFNMKDMTTLSCIVFIASFVIKTDASLYAMNRVIGTFLGIVIGVGINYAISSPNVEENFFLSARQTYDHMQETIRNLLLKGQPNFDTFQNSYAQTKNFYKLLCSEVETPFHHDINLQVPHHIIELLEDISVRMSIIRKMKSRHLSDSTKEKLSRRFLYTDLFSQDPYNKIDDVYNYHIEYLLKYVDELYEFLQVKPWTTI